MDETKWAKQFGRKDCYWVGCDNPGTKVEADGNESCDVHRYVISEDHDALDSAGPDTP